LNNSILSQFVAKIKFQLSYIDHKLSRSMRYKGVHYDKSHL